MTAVDGSNRLSKLRAIAAIVAAVLFVKVLLAILLEYRWYFPADFDSSSFLSGRRYSFFGVYRAAFYAHIISGPVAVVLGVFMMVSGGRSRYRHIHRAAGRLLLLIVLTVVVPSGLVMARQAYAGPIAASGFASLSLATAACAATAVYFARARNFRAHQRWATRCFPSCAVGGTHAVDGLYSAGSLHPGGVQVLVVDGSIRFVSETIDAGDPSHPPVTPQQLADGPIASPYGVWGALGTSAGEGDQELNW